MGSPSVVIAESVGLVRVVEHHQPPARARRLRALGNNCEFRVGQHGALVDYRNLDGWGLCVRGVRHIKWSPLERNSENAQRELRDSVSKRLYADAVRKMFCRKKSELRVPNPEPKWNGSSAATASTDSIYVPIRHALTR